ncbi:MAG: hypothetical protein K8I27_08355 [Planctomycetes bacterium]|nr:hypothetical protein [Planctomycetota bacterium]
MTVLEPECEGDAEGLVESCVVGVDGFFIAVVVDAVTGPVADLVGELERDLDGLLLVAAELGCDGLRLV